MANRVKYDNCLIINLLGEKAFKCDEDKANWYIKEGHGKKIAENPFTV